MRWFSLLEPSNRNQSMRNDGFGSVWNVLLETSELCGWRRGQVGPGKGSCSFLRR